MMRRIRLSDNDPAEALLYSVLQEMTRGKRSHALALSMLKYLSDNNISMNDVRKMARYLSFYCGENDISGSSSGSAGNIGIGNTLSVIPSTTSQKKEKKPKKTISKSAPAPLVREEAPAPAERKTRPAAPVQPARHSAPVQETPQLKPTPHPRPSEPPAPEQEPMPPRPVKPPIPQWSYKDEKGHQQALDISEQDQQILYDYYQEIYWKWFNLRTDVADVDYDPEEHRRDVSEEEDPLSDVLEDIRESIREAYNNLTPNGKIDFHETLAEGLPAHKAVKLAQFTR